MLRGLKNPVRLRFVVVGEPVALACCFNMNGFHMDSIGMCEDGVDAQVHLVHMLGKVAPYLGSWKKRERNSALVMDNAPMHRAGDAIQELMNAVNRKEATHCSFRNVPRG